MTAVAREAGFGYARENVLVGPDGEAMALYRMDMVGYPLLNETEKWALQDRLERLAHLVQADFSLWRVCRPAGDGRAVEVYLGVALTDGATGGFGSVLLGGVDRLKAYVMGALRRAPRLAITTKRLSDLAGAERRVHDRLAGAVDLRRARTRELEWLLRRAPLRGIAEPELEPFWTPDALVIEDETGKAVYEPLGWDLWRLPACVRFEDPAQLPSLQLDSDEHHGVQVLLAVGALAEEPLFPGPMAELLHAPLDDLDFPVDAVVHARWLGNRQALAQVHKRVVDAEQTYRDQLESSYGPAWQADDDRTLAREYEQVLQSGARPPMLYASISLAVGAGDRDVLERRVERLRSAFGEVRLYRPRGLQETLWLDHLPRVDGGRVGDYVQQVTAQQFGAMVPTATTVIGDDGGLQLGHTVNGLHTPVRLDVTAPSRDDRPGGMLLSGNTGAGKTIAAELMALDALERGSLVVDFDPKGDHFWPTGVADRAQVLELAGGQDASAGALDPLVIAPPALREDLALSYLLELLPDPPASWEHALARGVRDVSQAPRPSTRAVLRRLRELEGSAGGEVADALEVIAEVGLGRLGFGEHRDVAASPAAALTTIRVPGLVLPRQGAQRETYTRSERVSVATLSLATARAMQIVTADRTRHKLLILDESWFLLSTPQGQAFFDRLARYVRAFNATLLLLTHLVEDAPGIRNLVRGQLIMRHDSIEQIELALSMAGIEPTEERVARLLTAEPGFCVMRDLRGRVGEVQIEADPDLLAQLSTTPPASEEVAVVA